MAKNNCQGEISFFPRHTLGKFVDFRNFHTICVFFHPRVQLTISHLHFHIVLLCSLFCGTAFTVNQTSRLIKLRNEEIQWSLKRPPMRWVGRNFPNTFLVNGGTFKAPSPAPFIIYRIKTLTRKNGKVVTVSNDTVFISEELWVVLCQETFQDTQTPSHPFSRLHCLF